MGWYSRASKVTTWFAATMTFWTRADAGKLTFAVAPGMAGRLTNTETLPNPAVLVDTLVHSWSPMDVKPTSIHVEATGSCDTILNTSVEVFVFPGHLSLVGLDVGAPDGAVEGTMEGTTVGIGVGFKDGEAVGSSVGSAEGSSEGIADNKQS